MHPTKGSFCQRLLVIEEGSGDLLRKKPCGKATASHALARRPLLTYLQPSVPAMAVPRYMTAEEKRLTRMWRDEDDTDVAEIARRLHRSESSIWRFLGEKRTKWRKEKCATRCRCRAACQLPLLMPLQCSRRCIVAVAVISRQDEPGPGYCALKN